MFQLVAKGRTFRLFGNAAVTTTVIAGMLVPLTDSSRAVAASNPPLDIATVAQAIETYANRNLQSTYTGVVISPDQQSITVYATDVSANFRSAITDVSTGVPLNFTQSPQSMSSMLAAQQRVLDAIPDLAKQGIHPTDFWPEIRDGLLHVKIDDYSATRAAEVQNAVGPGGIVVEPGQPVLATATRDSDFSPFNAGDTITNVGTAGSTQDGCTLGFGVHIGSTYYSITAQHCGQVGDSWANAYCYAGNCPDQASPAHVGTTYYGDITYGGLDAEILHVLRDSNAMWKGPLGSSASLTVAGWMSNPAGESICNNGAYSGEECGTVISGGHCLDLPDGTPGNNRYACHEILADEVNSDNIMNETGDSGGPITHWSNGAPYAVGVDSAEDVGTGYTVPCIHLAAYETCSTDIYYTPVDQVLNDFGATLN